MVTELAGDFLTTDCAYAFYSVPIRAIRGFILCAVAWPPVPAFSQSLRSEIFESMNLGLPNQITGAKAGQRLGFAVKSRVVLRHRPGVAQFQL